ncbi:class I SAM-dependent methyltransferase [Pseudorhodoferax sp.]|uniref:class I SAM-dependent methyltransferase n=1 Tax=Pseudorhodoferax sp. TaxID=1993553 RepID=UPI002DD6340C|nr:class I SAM-dependent methyltransferase [Pseudorhodoferax sp.]
MMSSVTSCLICQNTSLGFLYTAKGYDILGCRSCGFCQVGSPPDDAALEDLYRQLHLKHTQFRDERAALRENQTRLQLVLEFVKPGALVLDAGCATGDFLALAQSHFTVYGVDISAGAIQTAQARLPDIASRLAARKLEDIGTDWPQFDAICLWDVIEHVRDPAAVCRTLMGLLKPGGHLFLSTPDMGSLAAKLMRRHWAFMIPPLHLGFFSRRSLGHLFDRQVPARIATCRSRGKWTSLAFLFYKLGQISRFLAPPSLLDWLSRRRLGHLNLYVPTHDILYLAARKPTP